MQKERFRDESRWRREARRRARWGRCASLALCLAAAGACGDGSEPAGPESRANETLAPDSSEAPTPSATGPSTSAPPNGAAPGAGEDPAPSAGPDPAAPSDAPSSEAPMEMLPLDDTAPEGGASDGASDGPATEAPMSAEEPAPEPEPLPEFAPCPADGTPCAIMPLGDSITFGLGAQVPTPNQGGYRIELFRRALADGHEITFVGREVNGPNDVDGQPFPRAHEGYSGSTINDGGNQLASRVGPALEANTPHIVLLMIGTNDTFQQVNNPPSDLGDLLDQITEAVPDALLVVAQIVPTGQAAANTRVQAYNATIPALVQERAEAGKHVIMVDMFTPFVSSPGGAGALLADIVHPNDAGYAIMADTWYAAIEGFLP